ncbi:hypothetical protein BC937DRAFT_92406 [Endogone sp. FLAS-F59071]|nr:hypothetical protein BC937DRAFT_92406 [Endogone sp. FLAS-F59071]|eukprot:RUS21530.1 hypothetical protein BC937DRAFT_92406 [Endogone sp. FLAS-F59071]
MTNFQEHILVDFCLKYQLHASGTNLEGSWDEAMNTIKKCHDAVHKMGCQRIASNIRIVSRTDKISGIDETVGKVQQ